MHMTNQINYNWMEKINSITKKMEAYASCSEWLGWEAIELARIRDTICMESVNEVGGFAVNTGFSNPKSSIFITRTYSSNIATFIPVLVSAAPTWETYLEYVAYWEGRRWLPTHLDLW